MRRISAIGMKIHEKWWKFQQKAGKLHQKYKNSRKNVENLNKMRIIPSNVWKLKKNSYENSNKKAGIFHLKYENWKKYMKILAKAGEFHQMYENSRKNAKNFNKMGRISAEGLKIYKKLWKFK